jgi:hypothetical protein
MKTVLILVDVNGAAQLNLTDDGSWTAPGDPHRVLRGQLSGRHRFEPDDATGVLGAQGQDIFKLAGFRFAEVSKADSGAALNARGELGEWSATEVFNA